MMEPPKLPERADGLWRRLARAQDAALANAKERSLGQPDRRRDQRSRRAIRPAWVGGALVAATLGAGAFFVLVGRPLRTQRSPGPESVPAESHLLADARSDLPLRFADGSAITFLAGSAARMQRLTTSGAEVVLERGRVEAHVVHAASTLWLIHAGPFQVRVTGTRFAVAWAAAKLEVTVYQGSVVVEGALLGAGLPLAAGQRLTIDAGVVRTEPISGSRPTSLTSPAEGPTSAPVAEADGLQPQSAQPGEPAPISPAVPPAMTRAPTATAEPMRDDEWLALATKGEYAEALVAARRMGWSGLCRRLDARRLLILGDVARYAGAPEEARRAFEALVTRFPADRRAADAVFSLGRLAFEAERPEQAVRWFGRYVEDWPGGPLADQAAGRLVECAVRTRDQATAENAARAYLERAPLGPHAGLARQVLGQSSAGPP